MLTCMIGTPAGDPIEAEAISSAFFGNHCTPDHGDGQTPLFVGSIKTVLGHAEGAAGLAGVLKASLALQNKIVPPNLLLDELSPKVKPFCTNLKILSSAIDWPSTTLNGVRRASVNSFGFGGANSHAILESFNADVENIDAACAYTDSAPALNPIIPFNFSSGSSGSLREHLAAISSYLANLPRNKIRDFAWTMNSRRTTLPTRVSISVSSEVDLIAKLNQIVNTLDGVVTVQDKSMQQTENPRLLGIFTGQGAQWTQSEYPRISSIPNHPVCLYSQKSVVTYTSELPFPIRSAPPLEISVY
jgi:hybrid polyketide synthase / nonribosomal peptide synthetase ACE1